MTPTVIGPMQGIWRSSFAALCLRLSAKNSGRSLRNLVQPFLPITRGIDLGAGTGNAPASI
jgi:hypothetical protein